MAKQLNVNLAFNADVSAAKQQIESLSKSLKDIAKIMGDKPFSVIKTSGKTKAGRDFVNCELDIKLL